MKVAIFNSFFFCTLISPSNIMLQTLSRANISRFSVRYRAISAIRCLDPREETRPWESRGLILRPSDEPANFCSEPIPSATRPRPWALSLPFNNADCHCVSMPIPTSTDERHLCWHSFLPLKLSRGSAIAGYHYSCRRKMPDRISRNNVKGLLARWICSFYKKYSIAKTSWLFKNIFKEIF